MLQKCVRGGVEALLTESVARALWCCSAYVPEGLSYFQLRATVPERQLKRHKPLGFLYMSLRGSCASWGAYSSPCDTGLSSGVTRLELGVPHVPHWAVLCSGRGLSRDCLPRRETGVSLQGFCCWLAGEV